MEANKNSVDRKNSTANFSLRKLLDRLFKHFSFINLGIFRMDWEKLTSDPIVMDARLRSRISLGEFFGIGMALSFIGIMVWLKITGVNQPYDFNNYMKAAHGDYSFSYYGYWILPLYQFISWFPDPIGYTIWTAINLAGIFGAARVFGGKTSIVLFSYQVLNMFYWGQITGILLGAIAFFWWSLSHKYWHWAGLGLIIACAKFQLGIPLGFILLWLADISWNQRLKVFIVPLLVGFISLFLYPNWPITVYTTILSNPPVNDANITFWRWVGPAALLLWIPPLFLPLQKEKRAIALVATLALAQPYFLMAEILSLMVMPIGWFVLVGDLGVLFPLFSFKIYYFLAILPLMIYLIVIIPSVKENIYPIVKNFSGIFKTGHKSYRLNQAEPEKRQSQPKSKKSALP